MEKTITVNTVLDGQLCVWYNTMGERSYKMKKIICAVLSIAMLIAPFTVHSATDTCNHYYKSVHYDKTCVSYSKTVHTCIYCNDTYTVYDWEYNTPENFALAFESVRNNENMTLTVNVKLFNNPGLLVARTRLGYNTAVLKPISFKNGTVWDEDDYFADVSLTSYPLTVYTEEKTEEVNYKNGDYFTFVFSIIDPNEDYGFEIIARKADYSDELYQPHQPEVIDRIGKKELGCHVFGEPQLVLEPTFDTMGKTVCCCAECDEKIYEDVPVLEHWRRGDINNDSKVNAGDCSLLKKLIVGKLSCDSLQMKDAADLNHDGKLNAGDAIEIKRVVVGKS